MSPDVREVAMAIVHDPKTKRVLMISSRKHSDRWILPKGGVDKGETSLQAAVRESWEEAGTPLTLRSDATEPLLIVHLEPPPEKKKKKEGSRARWSVHVLTTTEEEVNRIETWPESHERGREWVTLDDCLRRIHEWYTDPQLKEEVNQESTVEETRITGNGKDRKGGAMELAVKAFMELQSS